MSSLSTNDPPLNTSYKVLADIVGTNEASFAKKTAIYLGTFNTILTFWQFWNGFKRKQTLKSLPKDVNLRVFRDIVQETTDSKQWCGETWSARLWSETDNQMTDAIIKICVQFSSEQLSRMMNGVTFMRRSNGDVTIYSVEIWLEKGLPETVRRLSDILKNFCVENSIATLSHTSRTSGRIGTIKEPETRYRVKQFEAYEKTVGVQKMPKDLLTADLQSLFAPVPGSTVKTSRRKKKSKNKKLKHGYEEKETKEGEIISDQHSAGNIGEDANRHSTGNVYIWNISQTMNRSESAKSSPGHTSSNAYHMQSSMPLRRSLSTDNNNGNDAFSNSSDSDSNCNISPGLPRNSSDNNPVRILTVHSRTRSHTIGASTQMGQSLRNQLNGYFGHLQAYETTIVEKLDEKWQQILAAEGCPVCLRTDPLYENNQRKMRQFHKEKNNGEVDEIDNDQEPEGREKSNTIDQSWVIIKCKLLSCQHVMHASCTSNIPDITLKAFHCSSFFRTLSPRNEDDDFVISPRDTLIRHIRIRFRVNHLLSDKSSETIMDLSRTPTRWHQNSNKEYALVTTKEEKREIYIPIRRGRIVCELEIPLLNKNIMDSNKHVNNTTNNNNINLTVNKHDSNFEIPPPTYDPKTSSTIPSQLPKHTLVLAESQDYVLTVIVGEVIVHNKIQLQLLSLRYMFTPPEKIMSNNNNNNNNELSNLKNVTSSNSDLNVINATNGTKDMNLIKETRTSAHVAPIHHSHPIPSTSGQKVSLLNSNERSEQKKHVNIGESSLTQDSDEGAIRVSNIKPRIVTNISLASATRVHTTSVESINNISSCGPENTTVSKLINDHTASLMKPLSLASISASKTIVTNKKTIESESHASRRIPLAPVAQTQQSKGPVLNSNTTNNNLIQSANLPQTLTNSPGLTNLTSPYPSIGSPAHLPMGNFSLNNTHKFTSMNANAHRQPFMSPATMSIDHLMTQANGLTTPNLLLSSNAHLNNNNSPFWLASAQTPNLPPLVNALTPSVGLSGQQDYIMNIEEMRTLRTDRSHGTGSITTLPHVKELIETQESDTMDSVGNDLNVGRNLMPMNNIPGMVSTIGPRSIESHSRSHSIGENNVYRVEYNTSPLSTKSNNIMGVLTDSPTRSEKYTPYMEPGKIVGKDKANGLMTTVFDTPDLTSKTVENSSPMEPTNLILNPNRMSSYGEHNVENNIKTNTNTNINTQLLAQLLSNPPLMNMLQQWGVVLDAPPPVDVGVTSRHNISSSNVTPTTNTNVNNSISTGPGSGITPVSVSGTSQVSQSYGNVGSVNSLMNNTYAMPIQQSRGQTYNTAGNNNMGSMYDLNGGMYFLSKSQEGSRLVQEKLHDASNFNAIYNELYTHIPELMMDNFGHYVVEALFAQASDLKKLEILKMIEPQIGTVACHKQGSFSIQSLMDTFTNSEQMEQFVKMLQLDIKKIILSNSGHFVILRYLQRYKFPWTRFIHKAMMNYTVELATDHYGLRVMKAAMDAGPVEEMNGVYTAVVKHTNALVENQYGNYVIQHLLEIGPRTITDGIKEKMHGKFVRYAKQKFSSNVVEKCLRHSQMEAKCDSYNPKDWNTIIVRELCSKAGDLISDKYGNYCLQTALQTASLNIALLEEFTRNCRPHLENLRENVKTKWIKLLTAAASAKNRGIIQSQKI